MHPDFASEYQNVRLGLYTNGFTPFANNSTPYSCWPVFVTPYNLPSGMCMNKSNIFLSLIIPGPTSLGQSIDVFLRSLIDELQKLWSEGVCTFDAFQKQNFNMRVAFYGQSVIFLPMGCCQGGAHMVSLHVLIVWNI